MLANRSDRRGHIAGFRHHPELAHLALEHHADAVANDPVIVRDDHVDRSIHPWRASLHRKHTVATQWDSFRGSPHRPFKDYTDRHLWDYTIGTTRSTDKRPARTDHVVYAAQDPIRDPSHDLEGAHMIALSIAMTWLTLTAAGFAALSALGRIELRDDLETDLASLGPERIALTDTWPAMPGMSPP